MLRNMTTFLIMSSSHSAMVNSSPVFNSKMLSFHGATIEPSCQFIWNE